MKRIIALIIFVLFSGSSLAEKMEIEKEDYLKLLASS
jgi:hypothetical protein